MNNRQNMNTERTRRLSPAVRAWWLVFKKEFGELWTGGKALVLILLYTVLLAVTTYVMASNSELSLIPPNEMVYETLKDAIAVALFIGLIIGADSLSGERERATLETLLLTPASRRQIVVGKFLAAISPWPVALLVTIPYLSVLSQGDRVLGPAVVWGAILGSLLAFAYTALGMVVSFLCNSNRTSFFTSLGIYIMLLVPSQLPGTAQSGPMGQFLQWVNPVAAVNHFLSKTLVNNRTLDEYWPWLAAPVLFTVIVLGLLLLFFSPGLRLEGGRAFRIRRSRERAAGMAVGLLLISYLLVPLATSPIMAFDGAPSSLQPPLQITIDLDYKQVNAGDHVPFNTEVTNAGAEQSSSLIVAMNIINLDAEGEIVDPEDWSPQRTQYIKSLAPNQSAKLAWQVDAILEGDYMVYMVVIPAPDKAEETSQPIASQGIHLIVKPFTRLNPGGVLPYAIGGPLLMLLITFFVYRRRTRGIDMGGDS